MQRRHSKTVHMLALSAGLITGTVMLAAPAQADPTGDAFVAALTNAGLGSSDPANAVALGQSICPMLSEPSQTAASRPVAGRCQSVHRNCGHILLSGDDVVDRKRHIADPALYPRPLTEQLFKLPTRTSLDKERHVLPQGSPIEPSVYVLDDRGHRVRWYGGEILPESLDKLVNDRLFVQLDHAQSLP